MYPIHADTHCEKTRNYNLYKEQCDKWISEPYESMLIAKLMTSPLETSQGLADLAADKHCSGCHTQCVMHILYKRTHAEADITKHHEG